MRGIIGIGGLNMGLVGSQSANLQYWQFMNGLFDIQVFPLDDPTGTTVRDAGKRNLSGSYTNSAGLILNNDLAPFHAPILGATTYINHNAANISSYFSFATGTHHFWVKAPLSVWDDVTARRLSLFQVDTSNRIDVQKLGGADTLQLDYRCAGVSNVKTVANLTYASGWIPIALRWNKAGDACDVFINGHLANTITTLGNISGTITNASVGGNPYFPGGSLSYIGLGTGLIANADIARLANKVSRQKLIVFHGDSLTTGLQLGAIPYPKQMIRMYYSDNPVPNVVGYNNGESGKKISDLITTAATNVDGYFNDGGFQKKVCVFMGGTNDISTGADALTVENRLINYWQDRRSAGWKVVSSTIIPNGVHTAGQQTVRNDVNAWIRANYSLYTDGLADPTFNAVFDAQSDTTNTTYYNADTTHLTTAGYGLIAGVIKPVVDGLS